MNKSDVQLMEGIHPGIAFTIAGLEFGKSRLFATIKDLTPEQLAARPAGFANSIAALVVHVAAAAIGFAYRFRGEEIPEAVRQDYLRHLPQNPLPQPEGETVETLTAKFDRAHGALLEAMQQLPPADFDKEFAMGPERVATFRWGLVLLPNHQMQHLGQIQMIKQHL